MMKLLVAMPATTQAGLLGGRPDEVMISGINPDPKPPRQVGLIPLIMTSYYRRVFV